MGIVELLLIAVGLAMDACAVSACKGLAMKTLRWNVALALAFAFGLFQGLMPVVGWFLGARFIEAIEAYDHWIALALLGFIGVKMIWDAFHDDGCDEGCDCEHIDWSELLILAVATSIDALAVGLSLAALKVPILMPALIIGGVTFVLSLAGVLVGHCLGARFERFANVAGGVILIGIGVKIVLEHLGFLS